MSVPQKPSISWKVKGTKKVTVKPKHFCFPTKRQERAQAHAQVHGNVHDGHWPKAYVHSDTAPGITFQLTHSKTVSFLLK